MKKLITIGLLGLCHFAFSDPIDLKNAVEKNHITAFNRKLTLIEEKGYNGIRLSKDFGEGVAWLNDIEFSNGTLEFDVRGENIKQHSFVGIAFFGVNDSTYDAVYLRPFQFKEADDVLRKRSIQYISFPAFTWRKLRADSPGLYESSINPSPDPNAWVHMKLAVKNNVLSIYINHEDKPSLVVKTLSNNKKGKVGFYVADTSGGDFANISIKQDD